MKITKFGQCCLLIEIEGIRILTDPGGYTTAQNEVTDLDLILITHEHADHLHTDSLKTIVKNNPQASVITNMSVGKILGELGIKFAILEGEAVTKVAGLTLEAKDGTHAEIFESYGMVQNTGYFIAEKLFYPGDAYTTLDKPVPVLALPVGGPWCRATDAIHYAIAVAPEQVFPVHDIHLNERGLSMMHGLVGAQLKERGIAFTPLLNDQTIELS